MGKVIGVRVDDTIEWHAINTGPSDYNTMCGIDADDPGIGHFGTVEAKRGQKITCQLCHSIWHGVTNLRLRESNFDLKDKP